ncbi:helix-turn-helix domain-containing protein [Gemella cuniculi]
MNYIEVLKVLANETRLNILHLLKHPKKHFSCKSEIDMDEFGVCVEEIQRVSGLSQSTTSTYMNMMKREGLVIATRIGKYTYFKRNDEVVQKLAEYLSTKL